MEPLQRKIGTVLRKSRETTRLMKEAEERRELKSAIKMLRSGLARRKGKRGAWSIISTALAKQQSKRHRSRRRPVTTGKTEFSIWISDSRCDRDCFSNHIRFID